MPSFFSKPVIIGFLVLSILGILGGGVAYVVNLKGENVRLEGEVSSLTTTVKEQEEEKIRTEKELAEIKVIKTNLQKSNEGLNKQHSALEKKFYKMKENGSKRDIGYIAYKKPKLFQKIINSSTEKAIRCAEIAAGSPVTEDDKKNTECPEMVK